MAGFKTHITTSCLLGMGYTGTGLYMGLPVESSLIAGGMCGIGGMLPDIDSDSGIPFRESMGFAAAIIPVLMLSRFKALGLNFEQMVLICGAMYLFVRFGLARLLARYTVHRGMFHSLPAALIFAGVAFLVTDYGDLQMRYFKSAGLLLGVMSHLLLDEIYAVEWAGGRWRFKKSFGTAMKLWGKSGWANLSTYGKLVIVVLMILGEPMVMDRYGDHYEQLSGFIIQRDQLRVPGEQPTSFENQTLVQNDPRTAPPQYANQQLPNQQRPNQPLSNQQLPPNQPAPNWYSNDVTPPTDPYASQRDRTIYDTARRMMQSWSGEDAQR